MRKADWRGLQKRNADKRRRAVEALMAKGHNNKHISAMLARKGYTITPSGVKTIKQNIRKIERAAELERLLGFQSPELESILRKKKLPVKTLANAVKLVALERFSDTEIARRLTEHRMPISVQAVCALRLDLEQKRLVKPRYSDPKFNSKYPRNDPIVMGHVIRFEHLSADERLETYRELCTKMRELEAEIRALRATPGAKRAFQEDPERYERAMKESGVVQAQIEALAFLDKRISELESRDLATEFLDPNASKELEKLAKKFQKK